MLRELSALAVVSLLILTSCVRRPANAVEDLVGTNDLSGFTLRSLKGTRDGDRLDVRALYGDGARSLSVDLRFRVTPPTRMESGMWSGLADGGAVRQRSVTFLGGQSGAPCIGGNFELIGRDNRALYRVTIPLQQLNNPL